MIERIKVFEQQLKDQEIEIENRERQQMAILEKSDVNASLMFLFFFYPRAYLVFESTVGVLFFSFRIGVVWFRDGFRFFLLLRICHMARFFG
jgi:hypothetical protein